MRNILILILICAFAIPVSQTESPEITENVINVIPDPFVADDESDQCEEVIKITKKKRLIRLFRRK